MARLVAVSFSWAVATVGLGAVAKSRIGVSRLSVQFGRFGGSTFGGHATTWGAPNRTGVNETPIPVSWQTPTPVQGVVAVPRPGAERSADG